MEDGKLQIDMGTITHLNFHLTRMIAHCLKPDRTPPADKLQMVSAHIQSYFEALPSISPRVFPENSPNLDLCDLAFYTYCTIAFKCLSLTEQKEMDDSYLPCTPVNCLWKRVPMECPGSDHLTPSPARLFKMLTRRSKEFYKELTQWCHARRWYDRVMRPSKSVFISSEIRADDQLISLFTDRLLAEMRKSTHGDSFFSKAREWIIASSLPLAARSDFTRDKPFEGHSTSIATLFVKYVEEKERLSINTALEHDPVTEWDKIPAEIQDIWLLSHYCFMFNQFSFGRTRFENQYLILWHQWDQPHSYALQQVTERLHRPALPLICSLGRRRWGILSEGKTWRVCDGFVHALVTWLSCIHTYHRGESEGGFPLFSFGVQIPSIRRAEEAINLGSVLRLPQLVAARRSGKEEEAEGEGEEEKSEEDGFEEEDDESEYVMDME